MNYPSPKRFFIATFTLFILSVPQASPALDLIVEHIPTDPSHFPTIQAAIDYARDQLAGPPANNTTFRVVVKADPNPYIGGFTPISNVPIIGSETAGTFLAVGGPGTLILMDGVNNVTIKNFTILSAELGIAVTNSTSVTIANNIFKLGPGGIALQIQGSPSTTIVNNTFYQNGTALRTSSDSLITNNIFSGNGTAILTVTNLSQLTYNTYYNNANNGSIALDAHSLPNNIVTNPDPLFVDPSHNDFHLQSGSPCHSYDGSNAGNPSFPNGDNPAFFDMGAYGGPDSDTIPFMISGLKATSGAAANSIDLNWDMNTSYQVTGYKVYYGTTSGDRNGTGASEGNSPLTIQQGVNSATLSNLPITRPTTPEGVTEVKLLPGNKSFLVSWTPSAHATGYKIYYSTTSFSASSLPTSFMQVDGANTSAVSLGGLTNGVTYYVAVSAIAQATYFLTVTAFIANGGTPGVTNESDFAPEVTLQYLGSPPEGAISNVANASPAEGTGGFGNFDFDLGPRCFIATAAYGYYSAPQVQILREFRDRYLMTNAPGRAFVAWYYRHGPRCADFINAHPWCKPFVRLLLLPLIGAAMFLLHASLPAKCIVLVGILLMSGTIVWRKKTRHCEG